MDKLYFLLVFLFFCGFQFIAFQFLLGAIFKNFKAPTRSQGEKYYRGNEAVVWGLVTFSFIEIPVIVSYYNFPLFILLFLSLLSLILAFISRKYGPFKVD